MAARYSSILSLSQPLDLLVLLNPGFQSSAADEVFVDQFMSGDVPSFDRMIRSDFASYLPGDLLVKVDLATMANSLELRSPMLDVNVVIGDPWFRVAYPVEIKPVLEQIGPHLGVAIGLAMSEFDKQDS